LLDSAALTPGLMAVDRRRALLRRMARSLL
jgi:hypothetical protein